MEIRISNRKIIMILVLIILFFTVFILLIRETNRKEDLIKKEVIIDREKIYKEAKKRIMDSSSVDFIRDYPGVGSAAGRGKRNFNNRVDKLLQQRRIIELDKGS